MSTENKKLISVVVPVYNSTETLDALYDATVAVIDQSKYSLEIIFVDDHGKNESWKKLEEIKQAHPEVVRIIRLSKNFGQNSSTLCGIDHSKGDYVVTIDDDMEFDPKHIPLLLDKLLESNSDVVYGVFEKGPKRSIRSIGRRVLFFVLNTFENGANIGSSFRIMGRNIVERINYHNQDHLFINQIVSWYTSDIEYAALPYNQVANNKSGYSMGRLIKIGFSLVFYYTSFPLKLVIYFSFLAALISMVFAIYYLVQKVMVGTLAGYSSMIISVLVGTSIIMIGIGVLAVFVNRIYNSRIKKPNYSIKKMK